MPDQVDVQSSRRLTPPCHLEWARYTSVFPNLRTRLPALYRFAAQELAVGFGERAECWFDAGGLEAQARTILVELAPVGSAESVTEPVETCM